MEIIFYLYFGFSLFFLLFSCIYCKRCTKPIRSILLILTDTLLILSIINQEILFSKLSLNKVIIVLIDIAICLIYFLINRSVLKAKLKFGNYFIISVSFIKNLIKNKMRRVKGSIRIGHIVPFSNNDVGKCGKLLEIPARIFTRGCMITGATGSGKTFTLKEIAKQNFEDGIPVVYFDFKGDVNLRQELIQDSQKYGYDVFCDSEGYHYFFDPLAGLDSNGRVEALLNTRKWDISGSDSHYRQNAKLLIQRYVTQFDKFLQKKIDEEMIDMNYYPYTKNLYNFVDTHKPDLSNIDIRNAYNTFKSALELILTSEMKKTLMNPELPIFNFEDRDNYKNYKYLLIISIPSQNKELGTSMASFYLNNILAVATKLGGFSNFVKLYFEEFGSCQEPMVVKDLMEKGRSMNIHTLISMQDIFQIVTYSSEAFLDDLLGTIATCICFSGTTKKAAEKLSGIQIKDIDKILLSLRAPNQDYGDRPTALFITKNSLLHRGKSSEVYKIFPGSKIKASEVFGEFEGDDNSNNNSSNGPRIDIKKTKDNIFADMMEFKDLY